jgi:hypothetical protein
LFGARQRRDEREEADTELFKIKVLWPALIGKVLRLFRTALSPEPGINLNKT